MDPKAWSRMGGRGRSVRQSVGQPNEHVDRKKCPVKVFICLHFHVFEAQKHPTYPQYSMNEALSYAALDVTPRSLGHL